MYSQTDSSDFTAINPLMTGGNRFEQLLAAGLFKYIWPFWSKGSKATWTLSHKINFFHCQQIKNNSVFLVGASTTKTWLSICRSANWILCKVHYFRGLMINFQIYFILIYLKIIINAECLQYLPELTQQPDKKNKK